MKECEHYDNWCEKEKRSCNNCYYDKKGDVIIDILKSDLRINEKNFWYNIGVILTKRINGIIQILYNSLDDSIIVKIFHERFNYSICMQFPRWKLFEERELINQILNAVRYKIYEEVFK